MSKISLNFLFANFVLICCLSAFVRAESPPEEKKSDDAALERTRKQVQMLDDIYKTSIVLITENYVNDKDDLAAGVAFKKLFEAVKKKGWHEVRLIDATGEPYNDDNAPADDFEKEAIKQIKGGKPYFDKVVEKDGKRYLRATTIIPVVMDKCVICHDNYKEAKKGEAIGALGYIVPIE